MIKTKIKFEDIKAGDMIECVRRLDGVKSVHTGIAFEFDAGFMAPGMSAWKTSEGGLLIVSEDSDAIYRIDVREATFEDIQKGDLIRVSTPAGDTSVIIEGRAHRLVKADADWYDYWETEEKYVLMHRKYRDSKVEIVERNA